MAMMMFYLTLIEDEADQITFQFIYEKYSRDMMKAAYSILEDHHDSEDAVQNALLGLALSIKRVPTGNIRETKAYVMAAARNAAKKLCAKRKNVCLYEDYPYIPVVADDNVFETVASGLNYEQLLNCVKQMPLHYAEVLVLRYGYDFTTKEIAAAVGRPVKTVQQQIFRGKGMLNAIYQKEAR